MRLQLRLCPVACWALTAISRFLSWILGEVTQGRETDGAGEGSRAENRGWVDKGERGRQSFSFFFPKLGMAVGDCIRYLLAAVAADLHRSLVLCCHLKMMHTWWNLLGDRISVFECKVNWRCVFGTWKMCMCSFCDRWQVFRNLLMFVSVPWWLFVGSLVL